jgi:hypothetical protein
VNADQFNNGVSGADRRFSVVRRNEVFAAAEDEESYACAAQHCDCGILCVRDIRRRGAITSKMLLLSASSMISMRSSAHSALKLRDNRVKREHQR